MRMWLVDPRVLCRRHLFGEHNEMHTFIGAIIHGKKLDGYFAKRLLDIKLIAKRHDELANEIINRGYQHKSPITVLTIDEILAIRPDLSKFTDCTVDINESYIELFKRCQNCKDRYIKLVNENLITDITVLI